MICDDEDEIHFSYPPDLWEMSKAEEQSVSCLLQHLLPGGRSLQRGRNGPLPARKELESMASFPVMCFNKHMEHLLNTRAMLGPEGTERRSCCPVLKDSSIWRSPGKGGARGVGRFFTDRERQGVFGRGHSLGKGVDV